MKTNETVQMLKILTIYAAGLLIGAVSGFLPLLSLAAGLPVLVVRHQMGLLQARLMALATLVLTWIILDPLSFVIVSLGIVVGYSLLNWRSSEQGLGIAYRRSLLGGAIWLAVGNFVAVFITQRNLLALINEAMTQSFQLLLEHMTAMDIYPPEQLEFLQTFQEQAVPIFNQNWPIMAFVFISLSTTVGLLLLARYEPAVAYSLANWRELRAPAWLAIVTFVAHGLHQLAPNIYPWLVNNVLGIGNFVLFLSGYALVQFYMRHFRFSRMMGVLFTLYLFLSPWLRPILALVGRFDALFDYRYYARAKTQS